jgi:hypothetical protein
VERRHRRGIANGIGERARRRDFLVGHRAEGTGWGAITHLGPAGLCEGLKRR